MSALKIVLETRPRGRIKLHFFLRPMINEEALRKRSLKVSDKLIKQPAEIAESIRAALLKDTGVMAIADATESLSEFIAAILNHALLGYYSAAGRVIALEADEFPFDDITRATRDKQQWKQRIKALFPLFFNDFSSASRGKTVKELTEEKKLRKEYRTLISMVLGAYDQGYQTRFEGLMKRDSTLPPPPVEPTE